VPLPEVTRRAIHRLVGDNKRPYLTLPGTTNRCDQRACGASTVLDEHRQRWAMFVLWLDLLANTAGLW
jgi:hypothetical protein